MSSDRWTRADAIHIYGKVMHDVLGIPDASHPLRVALDLDGVTSLITLLSLSSSDMEANDDNSISHKNGMTQA